jgi:hypothetical protein
VEAQFSTRGITSQKKKFDHVIASLTPEYASEVRDIILHPPEARPYDRLREQLVPRTGTSTRRRLQQLLTSEELGDRKPSQLLRKMQQLATEPMMPSCVSYFSSAYRQTCAELAQLADRIVEAAPPSIAGVTAPTLQEYKVQNYLCHVFIANTPSTDTFIYTLLYIMHSRMLMSLHVGNFPGKGLIIYRLGS